MADSTYLSDSIIKTWKTGNRITSYLIENIPDDVWAESVPGYQQKTVQMIAGHMHNARCMWLKNSGDKAGVTIPEHVDRYSVSKKEVLNALKVSSAEIIKTVEYYIPIEKNVSGFGLDVVHFLTYLMSHEAHHRGQLIMVCRQLGCKLPQEVTYGVWKWSKRAKEAD
ncbi:DinB family protein [Gracilimonas sp. BCB1]|uniref:DinB family protein n=1 Tax=Gracilimonas sp. BCB1 TaxID=3152362 RepID=UPI0032D9312F